MIWVDVHVTALREADQVNATAGSTVLLPLVNRVMSSFSPSIAEGAVSYGSSSLFGCWDSS
ncbi:hypothetical protein M3J09_008034 [Ascochyta lentis]